MTAETYPRMTISIDDELRERIKQAAREESVRRGETVSASQWIREQCQRGLREQGGGQ